MSSSMFCTACAAPIALPADRCAACGADRAERGSVGSRPMAASSAPSAPRGAEWRAPVRGDLLRLLQVVPLVALLVVSGSLIVQARLQQEELAAAYAAAVGAERLHDYPAALTDYALAGAYADAPARLAAVENYLEPYQAAYRAGVNALDAGDVETAIELLLPTARDVPGMLDVTGRLADARGMQVAALWRAHEVAAGRRDWVEAERVLRALQTADPGQSDATLEMDRLLREHGPLVLGRDRGLWLVGLDGDGAREIPVGVPVIWPTWSPDRTRIAFLSYDPDDPSVNSALYVVGVDGTGLRRLAGDISAHAPPAWSPDGTRLAYTSFAAFNPIDESGWISLRHVDATTGVETDVTKQAFGLAFNPAWSPSGDSLAFVAKERERGTSPQQLPGDVFVARLASASASASPSFTNLTEGRVTDAWSVAWSPVDDRILIYSLFGQSWYEPPATSIREIDARSAALRTIDDGDATLRAPIWSPDGRRFAYVEGDASLRVVEAAGDTVHAVRDDLTGDLTWSPDGRALIALPRDISAPSLLIELDREAEPRPLVLEFDADRPYYAPPQWAPVAPRPTIGPPTIAGTGFDSGWHLVREPAVGADTDAPR